MRCTTGTADVQLWRHLTGEFVGAARAEKNLIAYFESDQNARSRKSVGERKVLVCLVDEIDFLTTRDEGIVYNFFNWPLNNNSGLLLIGVSNVMDLPERLSKRWELAIGVHTYIYTYTHIYIHIHTYTYNIHLHAYLCKCILADWC